MTPKIKEAIGRLQAIRGDGGHVIGTAFAVADRYLLTAFHVVGDRVATVTKGVPVWYPVLWFDPAGAESARLSVKVAPGAYDAVADWALLETEAPLIGISLLPLGEISQREVEKHHQERQKLEFESWGFPTLGRMSGSGITIAGHVQDRDARYQEAWAYQLYSENAAAAFGDPLNGLSGAPCLIEGAAVGVIRTNLVTQNTTPDGAPPHIAGGILYACPVATTTLQERCAAYLPSLDPVRGLPGLRRQALPIEPFRYLRWYGAEHAEVFFGRNRKLRELYLQITDPDTPSVVLAYGASGVGKSSLLEAGLLPRLTWNYEVRVQRREAAKTLTDSLHEQLSAAQAASQPSGKPVVVLLDQIEEVFTDPRVDGNAEVALLAQRLNAVLGEAGPSPRIILSFRSEWLANIRARFMEVGVPISEFYLERLTRDEIEEVVWGVVSTDRLHKFYGVNIDEDLPRQIANDLLADPESPVSPLLSIILTRLWIEAKTHLAGAQRLSKSTYDERMRNRLDLDQFLVEQIKAVALIRPEDVASGLVIDVLYRHTTDLGTAKELSWKELCETYYHLAKGVDNSFLRELIAALSAHSLLYRVEKTDNLSDNKDKQQVTRLAHDTLALPVRKTYQRSDLLGQRAERRLVSSAEDWDPAVPRAGVLEPSGLALIELGLRGTRGPTRKECDFIAASRLAALLTRRRSRRAQLLSGALVLAVVAGLTSWWKELWLKEQVYWLMHVRRHVLAATHEHALKPGNVFRECDDCPEMVVVPAGTFTMGAPETSKEGEGTAPAPTGGLLRVATQSVVGHPPHEVTIGRQIAVSKFEVTFDQWDSCFAAGGCKTPGSAQSWGRGTRPVINVSWDDVQEYVAWLSKITGKHYRLLSEAEWEYAARAGATTAFSWGDDLGQGNANCNGCGSEWDNQRTAPVGSFKPNAFGLYDMHGNVWEWVEDCYNNDYRGAPSDGSSWTTGDCNRRVIRGGSWITIPRALRSAHRHRDDFNGRYFATGVRVARSLGP